ncbi:MAG: class B sortase [Oscillospiraceae bacterium]|nr:class B sortase [Oscillospiraceae bacterium]
MSFASEQSFEEPKAPPRRPAAGKGAYVPKHAAPPKKAASVKGKSTKEEEKGFKAWLDRNFIIHGDDTRNETSGKLVTITAVIVMAVCLVILGSYLYEIYEAKKNHDDLRSMYSQNSLNGAQTLVITAASATEKDEPAYTVPSDNLTWEEVSEAQTVTEEVHEPRDILPAAAGLLEINPDTVGFVRIPGCVEEPVVKGSDNDFYLTHNFYGEKRSCGTCFADYRNVVGDWERTDNVTLYAHNQRDGTMFGNLDAYRWDYRYWQKNPFIYFNTNYSEDTYVIISSFVTNIYPEHDDGREVFDYQNFVNFEDEGQYTFDKFYSEIMKRSWFDTGIDCNADDKYLTLSTCSTEWDDSRHVIVARMLRPGETAEGLDTTNFKKNENPKWPAIYYKYNGGTYIEE